MTNSSNNNNNNNNNNRSHLSRKLCTEIVNALHRNGKHAIMQYLEKWTAAIVS